MKNIFIFLFIYNLCSISFSQQIKIGDWAMHLNYTNINVVVNNNETIYVGTKSGLFLYDIGENSVTKFSKLDGLSSLNVTALKYDNSRNLLIAGYNDGNIDIIQNYQIINIPHIQLANILGSKKINHIFLSEGLAYISCPFGLVVIDIDALEIKETYYLSSDGSNTEFFQSHVFDSEVHSNTDNFLANKIFVGTSRGLFYADKNDNLLDYESWSNDSRISFSETETPLIYDVGNTPVVGLIGFDQKESGGKGLMIVTDLDYSKILVPWLGLVEYNLFKLNPSVYSEPNSKFLNVFSVNLNVPGSIISAQYSENTQTTTIITNDNYTQKVILLDDIFENILSFNSIDISDDINFSLISGTVGSNYNNSKTIFLGDIKRGLIGVKHNNKSYYWLDNQISPNGPAGVNIGSIASNGSNLIFTHGSKTGSWNNLYNYQEISLFNNSYWSHSTNMIDSQIYDAISICGVPNTSDFFVGTWNSGLLKFNNDSLVYQYTEDNTNGELQTIIGTDGWIRIGGIDIDQNNILWGTNSQAEKPIIKVENDVLTGFSVPNLPTSTMAGKILCTSLNQKWIQLRNEGLLVVQESGGKLESKKIGSESGLASQTVNCFTEDLNGSIWVGTSQGLSVFYAPHQVFDNPAYTAESILIETEDGYVEKLFENTEILDIKIDGGNRKWVGTKTNGVFLISEDGTSQIHNFTKENSPLLDNAVYEISILGNSGEVFFATGEGLCSYRSNATISNNSFNNVVVFPNPVKREYSGDIAISGLSNETNIKITDVSGNLVFETISFGGTATWSGKNFNGERVATGVYLFFCSSSDFEDSIVKKVLIYN